CRRQVRSEKREARRRRTHLLASRFWLLASLLSLTFLFFLTNLFLCPLLGSHEIAHAAAGFALLAFGLDLFGGCGVGLLGGAADDLGNVAADAFLGFEFCARVGLPGRGSTELAEV